MDILGVASKIDGRSVFEDDGLKTFIYNGTSWRLTGEMIEVNVKCSDEKIISNESITKKRTLPLFQMELLLLT